jgi:hypothetical protein
MPSSENGPVTPEDYDFDYEAWMRDQWARRTRYGRAKMVSLIALLGLLFTAVALLSLPGAIVNVVRSIEPETHKPTQETHE